MSIEGWVGLFVVLAGMIASHVTLANNDEYRKGEIAKNTESIEVVKKSLRTVETDMAIIKNDQKHTNELILDIRKAQKEDLAEIKQILRQIQTEDRDP
jgi:septal ring factor EnvC (AmiA/AmiB activator)